MTSAVFGFNFQSFLSTSRPNRRGKTSIIYAKLLGLGKREWAGKKGREGRVEEAFKGGRGKLYPLPRGNFLKKGFNTETNWANRSK